MSEFRTKKLFILQHQVFDPCLLKSVVVARTNGLAQSPPNLSRDGLSRDCKLPERGYSRA